MNRMRAPTLLSLHSFDPYENFELHGRAPNIIKPRPEGVVDKVDKQCARAEACAVARDGAADVGESPRRTRRNKKSTQQHLSKRREGQPLTEKDGCRSSGADDGATAQSSRAAIPIMNLYRIIGMKRALSNNRGC